MDVAVLLTIFIYILIPLGIIVGAILGITSINITDTVSKKKRKKLAWNVALYPIVIAILVLVIWGVVQTASK